MFDFKKHGEHGKIWVYNNSAVVASSFAASAIKGVPFDKLVQNSYDSMGFEDPSYFISNSFGELAADGGQAISLRDFAKLGRTMMKLRIQTMLIQFETTLQTLMTLQMLLF